MTQSEQPPDTPARRAGRDLPAAIIVGLVLVFAVIGTVAFLPWGFILLLALVLSLGCVEVYQALLGMGMRAAIVPIVIGNVTCLAASYAAAQDLGGLGLPWHSVLLSCLGLTVLATLIWRMFSGAAGFVRDSAASLFIIGYIPLLGSFLSLLIAPHDGPLRVVTVMLCVASSDTGGYALGAWLGRHQMAPTISPKKTWEGMAGSVILASTMGGLLFTFLLHHPWWLGVCFGLLMVVSATAGDLIESLIKRDAGIKDMSSFLPGHGGVMDRLDSILVTAPVAWIALYLMVPGG
jgi:phosphatidate cytidylyltransferase